MNNFSSEQKRMVFEEKQREKTAGIANCQFPIDDF